METPGTSGGLKKLCVSANNLEEHSDIGENQTVSILDQDEVKLLAIFPEEIWRKIVGEVNRPSLESVNNSSSFFRRLLYPERQVFLFPSAWKILGVQYEVDSDPVYCDLKRDCEGNYLALKPKWMIKSILKLRLVCTEWCLGINKFYENLYHNYDTQESVLKPRAESGLDFADEVKNKKEYCVYKKLGSWSEYKLRNAAKVEDFLNRFKVVHHSQAHPFPFRKVFFGMDHLVHEEFMDYCSKMIQLLTKYGHHIWFCELYFNSYESRDHLKFYLKMSEILSLMPNLKVLRFQDYLEPLGKKRTEKIKGKMVTHPIPRLENLTFVSLDSPRWVLMENLLGNNPQVNKMEIDSCLEEFNFVDIHLPNLTHLAICFRSLAEFEKFENCGQLWRLEMLHVNFMLCEPVPFISHSRIFKCLEQWKNTLADVVITFPPADQPTDKATIVRHFGIRLDLPHVKRLRLRMINIMSLDLILPMRDLELLEFSPRRWRAKDWQRIPKNLADKMMTNEMIEFHSVRNKDMYNSNIWTFFPKLRRIHADDQESDFSSCPTYIRQKVKTAKCQVPDIKYADIFDTVIAKFQI